MRRRALGVLAGAALLLALYAAAGTWLAPRLVLRALEARASELGATLRISEVRTDPFALAVDLVGVELAGPGGARLAAAQSIHVDAAWASLWGDAWTVERAEAKGPYLELAFGTDGTVVFFSAAGFLVSCLWLGASVGVAAAGCDAGPPPADVARPAADGESSVLRFL